MLLPPPNVYMLNFGSYECVLLHGKDSIPRLGRSPGRGHGNPLQYSCLENPMDRGACWAVVHRTAKSWIWLKWLSMHTKRISVADGIKVADQSSLKYGDYYPGLSRWVQCNHKGLDMWKKEVEETVLEWYNLRKSWLDFASFDSRRGHQPRNVGSL